MWSLKSLCVSPTFYTQTDIGVNMCAWTRLGELEQGEAKKNVPILYDEGFSRVPAEPIKVDRSLF